MPFGTSLPARIPRSTGTEYYVSTTGNDSTGTGAVTSPWRTIQKAFDTVPTTGSIINLRAGTYTESGNQCEWTRIGNSGNPVTLRAFPSESVTVTGTRILVPHGPGASYLRISDLEVKDTPIGVEDCIKIEGNAHHIEIEKCVIHGASGQGVLLAGEVSPGGCGDCQMWDCIVYNNGLESHGIHDHGVYWSGPRGVLANCLLYDNQTFNVQWYLVSPDGIITCCTMDGGIVPSNPADARGGMILGSDDDSATHDCIIVGCISTNAPNFNGFGFYRPGIDNVGYDLIGFGNADADFDTDPGRLTFVNSSHADPLYVNRGTRDYRLQAGSPAIGKIDGARFGYVPEFDIDGNVRITADAGCYAADAGAPSGGGGGGVGPGSGGGGSSGGGAGSSWYQTPTTGTPTFSVDGMMAYDRSRNRMVLYGGVGTGESFPGTDLRTWELYGGTWHAVTTTNQPKQLAGPDKIYAPWFGWMVFDETREVCVLFFNANDGACETWTYNGVNWTDSGATIPYKYNSAAVWDPIGEQVVMWGGGPSLLAADPTYYTWNGTAWSSHTTVNAPISRTQHAMAYDQNNSNIVLFGGYTGITPPTEALRPNDTWTLDLSGTPNWTQESPTTIPYFNNGTDEAGEDRESMTFAEDLGEVILALKSGPSSTWLWDGSDWEEILPTVDLPDQGGSVVWDPEYGKTLHYGGANISGDSYDSWLFPAPAVAGTFTSFYWRTL